MSVEPRDIFKEVYAKQVAETESGEVKGRGFIQWKGTDVCIDVHCLCGAHLHFDAEFLYHVGCENCGRVYSVGCKVKLCELVDPAHQEYAKARAFHTARDEYHKVETIDMPVVVAELPSGGDDGKA